MHPRPVSPKAHAIMDYALLGGLLVLPRVLGLDKTVQKIYAAEALGLLAYVGLTKQPAAVKPLIPFRLHGRIDPFNIVQFLALTATKPFRRDRRAAAFNLLFTAAAATTMYLTDWNGRTQPKTS